MHVKKKKQCVQTYVWISKSARGISRRRRKKCHCQNNRWNQMEISLNMLFHFHRRKKKPKWKDETGLVSYSALPHFLCLVDRSWHDARKCTLINAKINQEMSNVRNDDIERTKPNRDFYLPMRKTWNNWQWRSKSKALNRRNRLVLIPDNDLVVVVFHQIQCVITDDLPWLFNWMSVFPWGNFAFHDFLLPRTIRHQFSFPTGIFLIWIIIEITFSLSVLEGIDHFRQIVCKLY